MPHVTLKDIKLLEEHEIGFSLPWLVEGKVSGACPERSRIEDLGNVALFSSDGTPREAGKILKWGKEIANPTITNKSRLKKEDKTK